MQHKTHPTDYVLSHSQTEEGDISFSTRRLYEVVEYAVSNARKAVSDRETGVYVAYSPSGFEGASESIKADCIVIHSSGLVEVIPHDYDVAKEVHQFDSTVDALDFIFDTYPQVSTLESVVYSPN